jgi:hypothetical protein
LIRIILLNDHYTAMDFMVEILISIFHAVTLTFSEFRLKEVPQDVRRFGQYFN